MRLLPRLLLQLVAPFLIIAVVVMLLLGNVVEHNLREGILSTTRINLDLRAQSLENRLATQRNTLRALAIASDSANEIVQHLKEWRNAFPEAEDLVFFSADGQAHDATDRIIDIRDRAYFAQLLQGEPVLTQVLVSRLSENQVVMVGEPVRDRHGALVGALGVTITLKTLAKWLHEMSIFPGGAALLSDAAGHPLVGYPNEKVVAGARIDANSAPHTAQILLTASGNNGCGEWCTMQREIKGSDWRITIAFPERIIFALIYKTWEIGAIAILTLAAAALAGIYLLNRSLLRPIHTLATAQAALERGEFARINSNRRDELGQLSRSFDQMATRLDAALSSAREAENRYRTLFENANDGIVLLDGDRFIDGNPYACQLFECSHEELIRVGPFDFSPERQHDGRNSQEAAQAYIREALAGTPQLFVWRHVSRTGRPFTAEVNLKRIEINDRPLLQAIVRDISAREAATQLARDMESKFQRVFSAGVDYMIVARLADGLIVEANDGFCQLTGFPRDQAIGRTTLELDLWHEPSKRDELVRALREKGAVRDYPMALRRRDGEVREVNLSVSTLELNGEPHYVSIARDVTDERNLQRALAASEARLKTIIETTPSPVCINRVSDLTYVSVNRAWEHLYGIKQPDVVGKTLGQCGFTAVDPATLRQQTLQLLSGGHVDGQEAEFITPDGRRVTIIYSSRLLELDGEQVFISINADISRLKEVERRLKVIVESAPAVIVINRLADFTYLDVNPEFERLFDCKSSQVAGKTIRQAGFSIVNPGVFREQTARLIADGRIDNAQAEFITAGGKHVSVIYSSRITELEGEPVMLSMAADITHIKEVEAGLRQAKMALQESEQRFIVLFQSSPIALSVSLLAAESYRLSELNAAWYRSFGFAADEVLGKSPIDLGLWPRPIEHADFYQQIDKIGEIHEYDVWLIRKDGSALLCSISAQRIVVGRQTLLLTAYVDITEKRRIEQEIRDLNTSLETRIQQRTVELQRAQAELMRSEKLAALGSLVAGVAHELNTPIGTSLTVASTLTERTREIDQLMQDGIRRSALNAYLADARSGADIIARNLQRAAELIQSFKSIAVDQASDQRREFDLRQIIDETLVALRPSLKKKPIKVSNEVEPHLLMNSYAGSLEQVVVNLVNNSILHGLDGRNQGNVVISGRPHGDDSVLLTVRDNGCGIPAANLSRVFDPFFTTKLGRGGSGLGLHIVLSIVEDILGGDIHVASEPGEGTTMTLRLPVRAPALKHSGRNEKPGK